MDEGRASPSLRTFLRRGTAASHDRLDRVAGVLALENSADYARFLRLQLAARAPIERWAAARSPANLQPPESVPLLLADLDRLGASASVTESAFDPPANAHPLGLAWAIAGSHLGNRAMLAALVRDGRGDLPTAFLSDPRMATFWRSLRPRLDRPAEQVAAAGALLAAQAVFACFLQALDQGEGRLAA